VSGVVFLVGAGPGDPGLVTLKAARLLDEAEVVVLDALVSDAIRALIPPSTEIIYAGKRASNHAMTQDDINALLVRLGSEGKRVVRLKGGDPFVFGRGGEEAEALRHADVRFEIVPGISSSIAGPSYAGIPVTHRTLATSFTVLTGHESEGSSGVDWETIARLPGTLICLMGLGQLSSISAALLEQGKSPETPVAVVSKATTPAQRTVTGTLGDIAERVASAALETPALIIIGEVVSLRESIEWFESRPLFGRTIVVTRARAQASTLASLLERDGAYVTEIPAIEIQDPADSSSLDRCIKSLGTYDWLIFSSSNGVEKFFQRLFRNDLDARALARLQIAAVGQATATQLERYGIRADLVPDRFQSKALLPLFPESLDGMRFAVVRAKEGNDDFISALRARGAEAELAVAYETAAAPADSERIRMLLASGAIDAITFTSGSTVEHFFAQLDDASRSSLREVMLASIGPVTSEALRRHGFEPSMEASGATVEALAHELSARLERRRPACPE
jgi:uroporphyrinogen III methyltransferase / synthase